MVLWSPVSEVHFQSQYWEDDGCAVVYVAANGNTHLVEPLALELLHLIQVTPSPSTAESLAVSLTEFIVAEEHDQILEYVEATLLKLLDVGLVTCASL